ncbi:MAG: beta-eliminating lyase-related protein, partial [Fusobacteria bacterium]|nr:beta-eliminating lyase-related protein [Fusobacteriota bacterium]
IKTREAAYKDKSIREINKEISDLCDIIYFSARKSGHARGGGIITNSKEAYMKMRELIGGLKFVEEPKILRFFFGKLLPTDNWQNMLMAKYQADFGDSL